MKSLTARLILPILRLSIFCISVPEAKELRALGCRLEHVIFRFWYLNAENGHPQNRSNLRPVMEHLVHAKLLLLALLVAVCFC